MQSAPTGDPLGFGLAFVIMSNAADWDRERVAEAAA
jgi:hypothetical protein